MPPSPVRAEVGWISREPHLRAPATLEAPITEGWPAVGSAVEWVAHVLNRGTETAARVPYTWRINDEIAESGVVDLPPGQTDVRLQWTWTFTRRRISFAIAPPPEAHDATTNDDEVSIDSDALTIGFRVQRGTYDWLAQDGGEGFERIFQRQLPRWNEILATAVFATAPEGALDRLRIDRIEVYDESLPRNEELLDIDLNWTFPTTNSDTRFLQKGSPRNVQLDQTIVLHELLHWRGLTDLYAYDVVHHDGTDADGRINIVEAGKPVVGTTLMPAMSVSGGLLVFRSPVNGLMGSQYRSNARLTELCVNGLNLWAGRRTPLSIDRFGNLINALSNAVHPDSYVHRLPQATSIVFTDQGRRLPDATVDVYLDHNPSTYRDTYAAYPDLTLVANADGAVTLSGDVLASQPPALTAPPKSQVIIFGVRTGAGRAFVFVPVYDLNLLYFRNGGGDSRMEVPVKLIPW